MTRISKTMTTILAGVSLPMLAGCGANEIASPGTSGGVTINYPAPTPTPTPTATPTPTVTAAGGCPTTASGTNGFTDLGTATGPTGSWRVCALPAVVNKSLTLTKIPGVVYALNGRVDVGCDGGFTAPSASPAVGVDQAANTRTATCTRANGVTQLVTLSDSKDYLNAETNVTLTIEPGVIVAGWTGQSWLAVNRGNKLSAVGTASAPIVFTSKDNIYGFETDSTFGHWGGVVLMGRAKITDCDFGSVGASTCERKTEGSPDPAIFGGADDTYNAGSMKYVQIRYSGYVLGADKELQALTTEGVGSNTSLEYIQSHNSSDDGAEFFGGTVKFKHYIATGADDDSLDADTGLQGFFQYVLLVQRPGKGDALMEIDSNGFESDTPRQKLIVSNFTALQPQTSSDNEANDQASILARGNADVTLVNGIVSAPNNECLRMHGTGTIGTRVTFSAKAVVMQCNATKYIGSGSGVPYSAADVAAAFGTGANANNDAFTPTLASLFINGANETAVTAFDAKTLNAFFDTTTYIGAVKDANDSWFKTWTCNSGYAPFDSTSNANRNCTSLPVT